METSCEGPVAERGSDPKCVDHVLEVALLVTT